MRNKRRQYQENCPQCHTSGWKPMMLKQCSMALNLTLLMDSVAGLGGWLVYSWMYLHASCTNQHNELHCTTSGNQIHKRTNRSWSNCNSTPSHTTPKLTPPFPRPITKSMSTFSLVSEYTSVKVCKGLVHNLMSLDPYYSKLKQYTEKTKQSN